MALATWVSEAGNKKQNKNKENNYLSKVFCFKLFKTLNQKKKKKEFCLLNIKKPNSWQSTLHPKIIKVHTLSDDDGQAIAPPPSSIHPCPAVHVKCSWNNIFWKLEWLVLMAPSGVKAMDSPQTSLPSSVSCPLLLPQLCVSTFFFYDDTQSLDLGPR